MLEDAIGNASLFSTVGKYLKTYQFRNADSREFFDILANNTHSVIDIVDIVSRWINVRRNKADFQLLRRRFVTSRRYNESIEYV